MRLERNGKGIDRLQESTSTQKLVYEKDKPDRPEFRQRLLQQLFDVARKRLMYEQDEMSKSTRSSVVWTWY